MNVIGTSTVGGQILSICCKSGTILESYLAEWYLMGRTCDADGSENSGESDFDSGKHIVGVCGLDLKFTLVTGSTVVSWYPLIPTVKLLLHNPQ